MRGEDFMNSHALEVENLVKVYRGRSNICLAQSASLCARRWTEFPCAARRHLRIART